MLGSVASLVASGLWLTVKPAAVVGVLLLLCVVVGLLKHWQGKGSEGSAGKQAASDAHAARVAATQEMLARPLEKFFARNSHLVGSKPGSPDGKPPRKPFSAVRGGVAGRKLHRSHTDNSIKRGPTATKTPHLESVHHSDDSRTSHSRSTGSLQSARSRASKGAARELPRTHSGHSSNSRHSSGSSHARAPVRAMYVSSGSDSDSDGSRGSYSEGSFSSPPRRGHDARSHHSSHRGSRSGSHHGSRPGSHHGSHHSYDSDSSLSGDSMSDGSYSSSYSGSSGSTSSSHSRASVQVKITVTKQVLLFLWNRIIGITVLLLLCTALWWLYKSGGDDEQEHPVVASVQGMLSSTISSLGVSELDLQHALGRQPPVEPAPVAASPPPKPTAAPEQLVQPKPARPALPKFKPAAKAAGPVQEPPSSRAGTTKPHVAKRDKGVAEVPRADPIIIPVNSFVRKPAATPPPKARVPQQQKAATLGSSKPAPAVEEKVEVEKVEEEQVEEEQVEEEKVEVGPPTTPLSPEPEVPTPTSSESPGSLVKWLHHARSAVPLPARVLICAAVLAALVAAAHLYNQRVALAAAATAKLKEEEEELPLPVERPLRNITPAAVASGSRFDYLMGVIHKCTDDASLETMKHLIKAQLRAGAITAFQADILHYATRTKLDPGMAGAVDMPTIQRVLSRASPELVTPATAASLPDEGNLVHVDQVPDTSTMSEAPSPATREAPSRSLPTATLGPRVVSVPPLPSLSGSAGSAAAGRAPPPSQSKSFQQSPGLQFSKLLDDTPTFYSEVRTPPQSRMSTASDMSDSSAMYTPDLPSRISLASSARERRKRRLARRENQDKVLNDLLAEINQEVETAVK